MNENSTGNSEQCDRIDVQQSTRRRFLGATGAGAAGLVGFAGTTAADESPPRLGTEGRWIIDPEGNRIALRGFATASLEFLDQDHPKNPIEVLQMATTGEKWHPNAVRLPITEWPVHEDGIDYVVQDLLRPAVDYLNERGVYAVIDFHLIRPYIDAMGNAEGMIEDGWADSIDDLGFDAHTPTHDLLVEFWEAVAPEFADDKHVLFELFNEPTLPVAWANYGEYGDDVESREDSWLLWRETAQPWIDLIRKEAAETPIIIGSPHWTSETQFAPTYPFEGDDLIYSCHIYPDNGHPDEFDNEYGTPAEEVPVVCTEFGWDPDEPEDSEAYGTTSGWGEPMREWLESYNNMGWLAWCFDDSWAPTFFESPADNPELGAGEPWALKDGPEQSGGFVRDWLADFRNHEPVWNSNAVYTAGDRVSWDGTVWEAQWWNQDEVPRHEDYYVWDHIRPPADSYGSGEWAATIDASTTETDVGKQIIFEAVDRTSKTRWISDLAWSFGDGTTANGWWVDHSYDTPGSYPVSLTATDNQEESTTRTIEIAIEKK